MTGLIILVEISKALQFTIAKSPSFSTSKLPTFSPILNISSGFVITSFNDSKKFNLITFVLIK